MEKWTLANIPAFLTLVLSATVLMAVVACGSVTDDTDQTGVVANGDTVAGDTAVAVTEVPANLPSYLQNVWVCTTPIEVTDLSNGNILTCSLRVKYTDDDVYIYATGIPNHDFESTFGFAAEAELEWVIPITPTDVEDGNYRYAPERNSIAFAINGAAIFGAEEGPGGDAVALDRGYFEEDRMPIELGLCSAHSAGSQFHYHADANCIHWHPDESKGETWEDYAVEVGNVTCESVSAVVGFGFDGYPIYGYCGYDDDGVLTEMLSSYRLKESANGYNGIDDYEYIEGGGHLDVCNGHFGPTIDNPEGLYHYHSTITNFIGELGFPYFLLCYHAEINESNLLQGDPFGNGMMPPGGQGQPNGGMMPPMRP